MDNGLLFKNLNVDAKFSFLREHTILLNRLGILFDFLTAISRKLRL